MLESDHIHYNIPIYVSDGDLVYNTGGEHNAAANFVSKAGNKTA